MVSEDKKIRKRLQNQGQIPQHIAIIMDGNGRWAKQRGLPRVAGHREGINAVRDVVEACAELNVQVLTLYTFSTENWRRPKEEVSALMKLLIRTLQKEINDLIRNNVKLMTIGEIETLPRDVYLEIQEGIQATQQNTGLILNLALSYGGREEILSAVQNIVIQVKEGHLKCEDVDDRLLRQHLYTAEIPDPDLLIRTSGELRISNFLLWQMAYTEIYITHVLWPDFRKKDLYKAIEDYQARERRFGKVSEQITDQKNSK